MTGFEASTLNCTGSLPDPESKRRCCCCCPISLAATLSKKEMSIYFYCGFFFFVDVVVFDVVIVVVVQVVVFDVGVVDVVVVLVVRRLKLISKETLSTNCREKRNLSVKPTLPTYISLYTSICSVSISLYLATHFQRISLSLLHTQSSSLSLSDLLSITMLSFSSQSLLFHSFLHTI